MQKVSKLSPAGRQQQEDALRRFHEELEKQPEISDEDFMAEFGAPDEEYVLGLTLPVARPETGDTGQEDKS